MSKTSRKTGFTLVELLVVIAIIGILVGLLLPSIGAAFKRSAEFAINNDVNELERGLELFKEKYQFYPPDMSEITTASQFLPWLGRISRSHQEGNGRDGGGLEIWWRDVGQHLDNESALVFWLSGFSRNAQRPLTIAGGSGRVAIAPYRGSGDTIDRVDFFDFRSDQLEINGNNVATYVQKRGASRQPYIYFHFSSYDTAVHTTPDGSVVRPYFANNGGMIVFPDGSDDSFQIIAAGVDGEYGATGDVNNITPSDNDNLCSFSDGRLEKLLNN